MARIYTAIEQLIGGTPLLSLTHITQRDGLPCTLLAKLECMNPAGSVKDRAARQMIEALCARGECDEHTVLIEPTSGNTGIALACMAASRGLRAIIVMPDSMSVERRQLMRAYGAQVVLTPGALGMQGAIDKANALAAEIPGARVVGQFTNPANAQAHFCTTGPELVADTDGRIDYFVAGVGTGGTLTGAGQYLKAHVPGVRVVAVEPATSPVLSGGKAGKHGIQGIGAGFIPQVLDRGVIDEVMPITDAQALTYARRMGCEEGVLVGISSGAALAAACQLAARPENAGKVIVALMPDGGERYLSAGLYDAE